MITREEAKKKLCMNLLCSEASGVSWVADDFVIELIDQLFDQQDQLQQHIKSLEAQLTNTEQLKCDGCRWYCNIEGRARCMNCERNCIADYYEKDTQ